MLCFEKLAVTNAAGSYTVSITQPMIVLGLSLCSWPHRYNTPPWPSPYDTHWNAIFQPGIWGRQWGRGVLAEVWLERQVWSRGPGFSRACTCVVPPYVLTFGFSLGQIFLCMVLGTSRTPESEELKLESIFIYSWEAVIHAGLAAQ